MTNATNLAEVKPNLADELLLSYREVIDALNELIDSKKESEDPEDALQVIEWELEREGVKDAIADREFRLMINNDRGEWFQIKVDLADVILTELKQKELALTKLINKFASDSSRRLDVARWKVERFNTGGAISTQEFNKNELIEKCETYKARIESYRTAIKTDWNPTLDKIKKKIIMMTKKGKPANEIEPYRLALDRADQPFVDEEEKIEFFIGLENMARD